MGLACSNVGSRSPVALEHRARSPAGQSHQICLAAALCQPLVSERVAELMRMQARKPGFPAAALEHPYQAPLCQPPAETDPEPGQVGMLVTIADTQVAVQRQRGLVAEGQGTLATTLAEHEEDVQVEVDIGQLEADQLPTAGAGIEQEHDEDGVSTSVEALALVDLEESP